MSWEPLSKLTHASLRCWQRYGFKLSLHEIGQIEGSIGGPCSMFVRMHNGGAEVWDVVYRGVVIRVLYFSQARKMVTVLPPTRSTGAGRPRVGLLDRLALAKNVLAYAVRGR